MFVHFAANFLKFDFNPSCWFYFEVGAFILKDESWQRKENKNTKFSPVKWKYLSFLLTGTCLTVAYGSLVFKIMLFALNKFVALFNRGLCVFDLQDFKPPTISANLMPWMNCVVAETYIWEIIFQTCMSQVWFLYFIWCKLWGLCISDQVDFI